MATVDLNARDASQVQSPQKVSVLTGEPGTWLLIYSGIALQRQWAEGSSGFLGIGESTSTENATVNVTIDNISGVLLQAATTASMSNIVEEETWGQWIVNSSSLSLRDNGDLVLTVSTSVTGGSTGFWSFYYYVSAKVVLDEASISGTIRWPKNLATPVGSQHFVITADTEVIIPPPPGGFAFTTLHPEASGAEGAIDATNATLYSVPYKITGALLGKTLTVSVSPITGRLSPGPGFGFGQLVAAQVSGPRPIHLTAANRHATNVDFELRFFGAPK